MYKTCQTVEGFGQVLSTQKLKELMETQMQRANV